MLVDSLREWFGTPLAAAKTIVWLCWVLLLASLLLGVAQLLLLGVLALVG
jgi:hypothetical protein